MVEYVLMAVMAAFAVLLIFLRTNAAVSFFAVCAGSILLNSVGSDMGLIASSLSSGFGAAPSITNIILLVLPVLVCAWLARQQVPKSLTLLNLLPAVCSSLLLTLMLVPLLDENIRNQIQDTETWTLLTQYNQFIVGVGLVSSVVLVSMTIKKPHEKHGKKHHK